MISEFTTTLLLVIVVSLDVSAILVSDNGTGMSILEADAIGKSQIRFLNIDPIPPTGTSYATSKVRTLSDLQTSGKYGYRGIALSALVSMATVEIRTRTQESEIGMRLIISEEGKRRTKEELKKKKAGTKIKVTDLSDRLVCVG